MLLSTAYFPPIHFFCKWLNHSEIWIEAFENYQKQSYRNRCVIGAANGVLPLVIPILKSGTAKQSIREVKISYETPWQRMHFQSIQSAYRHTPFYEFYIDDFLFTWEKKEAFLFDLNWKILEVLKEALGFDSMDLKKTTSFQAPIENEFDYRYRIHPKTEPSIDSFFKPASYEQVFSNKHGFQSNLSILDALFHLGPETRSYLVQSVSRI